MSHTPSAPETGVTVGSGNVFADLGLDRPHALLNAAELANSACTLLLTVLAHRFGAAASQSAEAFMTARAITPPAELQNQLNELGVDAHDVHALRRRPLPLPKVLGMIKALVAYLEALHPA